MKPHSHSLTLSNDASSLTHDHQSKRTFGQKVKQAYDAARNSVVKGNNTTTTSLRLPKENERRNWSYCAEDPIRTMMFLGSWGHT
ncbi:hypothetical protein JCGZ_13899 [Jatropha curcas]|uniref:Uncharacterized protein n=1 Tax=Jatropha curcas TaxID=180498 RepID=A0A067JZ97_JATCU|nr:hypothetical protein JCGZ_13899 [Jatropha curcas]